MNILGLVARFDAERKIGDCWLELLSRGDEGSRVVKWVDCDPELEAEVKRGKGRRMKLGGREHDGGGGVWSGNKRGL